MEKISGFTVIENQIIKDYIDDSKLTNSLFQVRGVMKTIWGNEAPKIVKDYTDHGYEHSERVAYFVEKLLRVNRGPKFSQEEIYLLLAGIYLHDIGMQCDVAKYPNVKEKAEKKFGAKFNLEFSTERASSYYQKQQDEIRKNHHYLSAAWIDCLYEDSESVLHSAIRSIPINLVDDLIDICMYHSNLSIYKCPEFFNEYPNSRKRMIASLLRFADELDISSMRVNIETEKIFSLNPENSVFWWLHNYTKINFIDSNKVNVKVGLHPEDFRLYSSLIRDNYIHKFKTKNQPILDVLVGCNIPVVIDYNSDVVENSRAEKLPSKIAAEFDRKILKLNLVPKCHIRSNQESLRNSPNSWEIGNLTIPQKILLGGEMYGNRPGKYLKEFGINDIVIRMVRKKPEVPLDVQNLEKETINEMLQLKKEKGIDFFNGGCFRLHQIIRDTHDVNNEDYRIILEIGETYFYSFVGTNCAIDKPLNANETIRTKYRDKIEFFTPDNFLSNRIAVVLNVFLGDGRLIVVKRSNSVALRRGTYQTSVAGGMKRIIQNGKIEGDEDVDLKGMPSPFVTAARECMAELNIKISEEEVIFLALSQDLEWMAPILIGEVRLNISEHDFFLNRPLAREKYEIHDIELVDFNPQNIRSLLINKNFAADSRLAIILSLMHRYSHEVVLPYFVN